MHNPLRTRKAMTRISVIAGAGPALAITNVEKLADRIAVSFSRAAL
jgi:hypothetical protein